MTQRRIPHWPGRSPDRPGSAPPAGAPGPAATDDQQPAVPSSVVAWGLYVDGRRSDCDDLAVATERAIQGHGFVWLGLHEPSDEDMAGFARQFNLHPLAIEDAVEGHTRSKLEQFGDTLFMVMSTVAYVDHTEITDTSEIVSTGQVMIFVGDNFVMTVRKGEHAELTTLRTDLEAHPDQLAEGPHHVLYSVLDKTVDDYIDVVQRFQSDIDRVEAIVFDRRGVTDIERVYQLKRELIEFRRAVLPLGFPLQNLATRQMGTIPDAARAYFREVSDHHLEAREAIQSFDEVLSTMIQAGLARASMADNEDMRKISSWVAIVAVPTLIAGIYGMNFDIMPELHWKYGYFLILGVMAAVMLGLYAGFKHNKWL